MKAAFPAKPTPIVGKPTLSELVRILNYVMMCAQTHKSSISRTMNLLYLVVPPEVYAQYTTAPYPANMYPLPPEVGAVPNYTMCTDNNDRARVTATHAEELKRYEDCVHMNTALTDVFLDCIDATYRAAYDQSRLRNPNTIFCDCFQYFLTQYGSTTADAPHANRERMAADWSPGDGFEALAERINTGMQYAVFSFHPIAERDVVDIAERVVTRCGIYTEEMKIWTQRDGASPNQLKTWRAFQEYWAKAIATCDDATSTAAGQHGFGLSAAADDVSLDASINNFSAAHQHTQATIAGLQNQNAALQAQQAAQLQQFTQTMNNMQQLLMMANARTPTQPYSAPPAAPPAPTSNQNPGRTNAANQPNQHQRAPNPIKRHKNWNYCHTHGFDVPDHHCSSNCPKPGPKHNWQATRNNIMGGLRKGQHKTMLPSQAGRRPFQSRAPTNGAPPPPPRPGNQPPAVSQPYAAAQPSYTMPMMNMCLLTAALPQA